MFYDPIVQKAIDIPRSVTLEDLANAAQIPRGTLKAYREGRLELPDPVRVRLVAFIEKHAAELQQIAKQLAEGESSKVRSSTAASSGTRYRV